MLRAMQTIHLAVRTIGTSAQTKNIMRAVVMIQSCGSTAIGIGVTTIVRLEAIRVIRRVAEPIVEVVDGVAILLLM